MYKQFHIKLQHGLGVLHLHLYCSQQAMLLDVSSEINFDYDEYQTRFEDVYRYLQGLLDQALLAFCLLFYYLLQLN